MSIEGLIFGIICGLIVFGIYFLILFSIRKEIDKKIRKTLNNNNNEEEEKNFEYTCFVCKKEFESAIEFIYPQHPICSGKCLNTYREHGFKVNEIYDTYRK